jgi:hypothetical protein
MKVGRKNRKERDGLKKKKKKKKKSAATDPNRSGLNLFSHLQSRLGGGGGRGGGGAGFRKVLLQDSNTT